MLAFTAAGQTAWPGEIGCHIASESKLALLHPSDLSVAPTERRFAYLEPHHLRRVSNGGPDHPAHVISLCPNCHRRVHAGADGQTITPH
jgi:HNH endonuclease